MSNSTRKTQGQEPVSVEEPSNTDWEWMSSAPGHDGWSEMVKKAPKQADGLEEGGH